VIPITYFTDPGISEEIFYHCGAVRGAVVRILLITPKVVDKVLQEIFRKSGMTHHQQTAWFRCRSGSQSGCGKFL